MTSETNPQQENYGVDSTFQSPLIGEEEARDLAGFFHEDPFMAIVLGVEEIENAMVSRGELDKEELIARQVARKHRQTDINIEETKKQIEEIRDVGQTKVLPKAGRGKTGKSYKRRNGPADRAGNQALKDRGYELVAQREGWPPFPAGDIVLIPKVVPQSESNPTRVYLESKKLKLTPEEERTRVSYELSRDGKQAMFAGMLVSERLRGRGLGPKLFNYFRKGLELKGLEFSGTACINKPDIARVLRDCGLVPNSQEILALLLPEEFSTDKKIRSVAIIRGEHQLKSKRQHSKSGKPFYEIVSLDQVPEELRIAENIVPLHTKWHDPQQN